MVYIWLLCHISDLFFFFLFVFRKQACVELFRSRCVFRKSRGRCNSSVVAQSRFGEAFFFLDSCGLLDIGEPDRTFEMPPHRQRMGRHPPEIRKTAPLEQTLPRQVIHKTRSLPFT